MNLFRICIAITALLYSDVVTPEQEWKDWQPMLFGAPCSTEIDLLELAGPNGECRDIVLYAPDKGNKKYWQPKAIASSKSLTNKEKP